MVLYPFVPDAPRPYCVTGFDATFRVPRGELLLPGADGAIPEGFAGLVFRPEDCSDPRCLRPAEDDAGPARWLSARVVRGSFSGAVRRALEAGKSPVWLYLEPLCETFPVPCPARRGKRLSREESRALQSRFAVHASKELLCRYCFGMDSGLPFVHLFDTDETLLAKLRLAEKLGISRAFGYPPPGF